MNAFLLVLIGLLSYSMTHAQFTAQLNIGKVTKSTIDTYQSLPITVEEPLTYSISAGVRLLPSLTVQGTFQNDWSYDGMHGQLSSMIKNGIIDFKKAIQSYTLDMEVKPLPHSVITPLIGMGFGQAVIRQTSIVSIVDNTYPGINRITYCPMAEEIKTTTYKMLAGVQYNVSEHYFITAKFTRKWFNNDERYILQIDNQELYSATFGLGVQL